MYCFNTSAIRSIAEWGTNSNVRHNLVVYGAYMGFGIKEAIAAYIKSGLSGDMAVRVDESPEIIGVGRRNGRIVPIVAPGSTLTAREIIQKAGIHESRRPARGRVRVLSDFHTILIPSRVRKSPGRLH